MKITVLTGSMPVPGVDGEVREVPIVEVWIGGRRFIHQCTTPEEARSFALATVFDLGVFSE